MLLLPLLLLLLPLMLRRRQRQRQQKYPVHEAPRWPGRVCVQSQVEVVSQAFEGMTLVKRQRMIYQVGMCVDRRW